MAAGLDLKVDTDIVCSDLPVRLNFTYLCNEEYICTFGQEEHVEGESELFPRQSKSSSSASASHLTCKSIAHC